MARPDHLRSARAGARGRGGCAARGRSRRCAGCAARGASEPPGADPLLPARAHRRSADDRAGARRAARPAPARVHRSRGRQLEPRHRRRRFPASIGSRRWTRRGWRAAATGSAPIGLLRRRPRAGASVHYDLAINFEPDIRTNLALAAAGAAGRPGSPAAAAARSSICALDYRRLCAHADNARRGCVHAAIGRAPDEAPVPAGRLADS